MKVKRKLPPDEKRCKAKTASGRRCKKTRRNGNNFCEMHTPGAMDVARKKGAAVAKGIIAERKNIADQAAARWSIRTFSDAVADVILDLERLEMDRPKMRLNDWWHLWWRGKSALAEALKGKVQHEGPGDRIVLIHEVTPDGQTAWQKPKGPRPVPAGFDTEEQGFKPPTG